MSDLVIGLLGGGGIASIIGAVIAGLFSKRKLGAEATKIITDAASGVVSDLRTQLDNERLDWNKDRIALEQKATDALAMAETNAAETKRIKSEWRAERVEWRRVLQLHVAFDHLAIARLTEAGVDLGMDPPPLLPPLAADLED